MIETRNCVACSNAYPRRADLTFDQGQCDDCIAAYFRERSAQHVDAAITADPPTSEAVLRETQRVYKIWHPLP